MLVHRNNFGFLRLLFASLVIVSHSSELIDGNRSREVATLFGSAVTFGELAVDGFFIVSGYLVLQSFERSSSTLSYLKKRVLRIYPGFLACFVVTTVLIGPHVGFAPIWSTYQRLIQSLVAAVTLELPEGSAFIGMPYPVLNGSLWSIPIEFRCYLLVLLLAVCGCYRRPVLLAIVSLTCLVSNALNFNPNIGPLYHLVGPPALTLRMVGMFSAGSLFYMFRNEIPFTGRGAGLAAIMLVVCISIRGLAEVAVGIAGSYLIFWFAFNVRSSTLSFINNGKYDLSYGVYLYAWPLEMLLIYYFGISSPWLALLLTLPLSFIAGLISWTVIEQPALSLKQADLRASMSSKTSIH